MAFAGSKCLLVLIIWLCWAVSFTSGIDIFVESGQDREIIFTSKIQIIGHFSIHQVETGKTLFKITERRGRRYITNNDVRIENITVFENSSGISFMWKNISLEDAGTYEIVSRYDLKNMVDSVRLIVSGKPKVNKIVSKSTGPPRVSEKYRIQCHASSARKRDGLSLPLSYMWFENGSLITSNNTRYKVHRNWLEILSLEKDDDHTQFTCRAAENDGSLTVVSDDSPIFNIPKPHYRPFMNKLIKFDREIHSTVGESAAFSVPIQAYPAPSLLDRSLVNGMRRKSKETFFIHSFSEETSKVFVIFKNVQKDDFGGYNIAVKNHVGRFDVGLVLKEREARCSKAAEMIGLVSVGGIAVIATIIIVVLLVRLRKKKMDDFAKESRR